jgi:hypothetical protein
VIFSCFSSRISMKRGYHFMGSEEAKSVRSAALEEGIREQKNVDFCPFGRCGGRNATPEQRCNACKRWDRKGDLPRTQGICFACIKTLVPITRGKGDWAERTYHKTCWKALGFPRTPEAQLAAELRIADDEMDPAGALVRRLAADEEKRKKAEEEQKKAEERDRQAMELRKKLFEGQQAAFAHAISDQAVPFVNWAKVHKDDLSSQQSRQEVEALLVQIARTPIYAPPSTQPWL